MSYECNLMFPYSFTFFTFLTRTPSGGVCFVVKLCPTICSVSSPTLFGLKHKEQNKMIKHNGTTCTHSYASYGQLQLKGGFHSSAHVQGMLKLLEFYCLQTIRSKYATCAHMSMTKPLGRRMNSMINPNFRISDKSAE